MGGYSLIKAAELRRVVQEAEGYRTAANAFRVRFLAIPGDFNKATLVWTAAHLTPSNCYTMDKSSVEGTCDGNGDGRVAGENTDRAEHFLFWHHLQKAGLIAGTYTGAVDPDCAGCTQAHAPGKNSPASAKGNNLGWGAYYKGMSQGLETDPNWFVGNYGHILTFGAQHLNSSGVPLDAMANKAALTVLETWNIDTKMDDGFPAKGSIVVRTGEYSGLSGCTETSAGSGETTDYSDIDAVYRLSRGDNQVDCNLILRNLF